MQSHKQLEDTMKNPNPSHTLDTKVALLEQSITYIAQSLNRIETKFDNIDKKYDMKFEILDKKLDIFSNKSDAKLEAIDERFNGKFNEIIKENFNNYRDLNNKIDSSFKWLLTIYTAGFGSLFGLLAHSLHWI